MVQAQSGQMSDEEGDEVRPEQSCLSGPDLLMHEIPDTHSLNLKKTSSAQAAPTTLLAAWLRCTASSPSSSETQFRCIYPQTHCSRGQTAHGLHMLLCNAHSLRLRAGWVLQPLDVDINAKRGPIKNWIGMDNVQAGIHRLFREFLQTFSLQGEHVYQGRLREMCSCAPCCPACISLHLRLCPCLCML